MLLPLLMTTIAGLSTGLGGLIAALFRPTPRLMAFCGGFAGAVMLTVSLADLAPALLDFYGALLSPFGCGAAAAALLLGGMLAAWLLACALPDEDTLADRFGSRTQGSAMRAALVTGAALLLHNLPEGILTLLTNVSDPQTRCGEEMQLYSDLLEEAVLSIVDAKEDSDLDSLFRAGGTTALLNQISGLDDFELICFLVVKEG